MKLNTQAQQCLKPTVRDTLQHIATLDNSTLDEATLKHLNIVMTLGAAANTAVAPVLAYLTGVPMQSDMDVLKYFIAQTKEEDADKLSDDITRVILHEMMGTKDGMKHMIDSMMSSADRG